MTWVLPLNGDATGRFPSEASAAVWKSRDVGETWEAKRDDSEPSDGERTALLRYGPEPTLVLLLYAAAQLLQSRLRVGVRGPFVEYGIGE